MTAISIIGLSGVSNDARAQSSSEQASPVIPSDKPLEKAEILNELFAQLAKETKPSTAKVLVRRIWTNWTDSGSATINGLMNFSKQSMDRRKFAEAEDLLDQVVTLAPDYSEGWNRRATLYFLMKQYGKSIRDIEQTLLYEPRHFGALAGLGMILQQLGNKKKALETWYKLLEIYPANTQAQQAVIQLEESFTGKRS
ncbi:MAG: hypothetical protein QM488_08460 [Rhizobiaceae bacterium]